MTAVCDLLFDLCNSDDSRYEKAGRDRRDRHHNRVCQEIEEVKELHSDHGHTGQWTIAKTGERSEQEHNDSHKYRRLFPAPVQLILKSGDGTLGQGDGTCDSREQDQNKKQDADCGSESHACEHLDKDGIKSMEKLIFSLVLLLTTKIIYLITGRNRRQIARIPKGMAILCQPPGRRYVAYAVGVFQLLFVAFFLVLYIKDGAPAEARLMWSLLVITSILSCMLLIFSGNVAGRDCVYFNSREVRIEKPFRKSRTFQWEEIRKVDGNFDNAVNLYLLDGTKVLTARLGMVNYDVFCDMIKKTCPEKIASYYRSHMYEESQKCILRYGSEYYLLAAMGIGILLIYMASLVPAAAENSIIQQFLQGDFSQKFALWFAPVCGVISIVFLVVMLNTNIRYSQEKMTIKYPLHRKRELYWRNIQRIEMAAVEKTEKAEWMKLRLYTREGTYKISFKFLTHGKDEFLSMLFKMIQKYGISCMQTDK